MDPTNPDKAFVTMHVTSNPQKPIFICNDMATVRQIPVWTDNYAWLLCCETTKTAAVIDSPEAEPVFTYAKEHGYTITTIFNTHTHPDHIGINRQMVQRGLPPDFRIVGSSTASGTVPGLTHAVTEPDIVTLGKLQGTVLVTEGHQNGHISFLFGEALFCGDTLFAGGCGHLFDGPAETMHRSLQKLSALPNNTLVFCAHEYTQDNLLFAWSVEPGNPKLASRISNVWKTRKTGASTIPSTIELEKATNPFLRTSSKEIREYIQKNIQQDAKDPADIFTLLRACKDKKQYPRSPQHDFPL